MPKPLSERFRWLRRRRGRDREVLPRIVPISSATMAYRGKRSPLNERCTGIEDFLDPSFTAAKMFVPRTRRELVGRPRLSERLANSARARLTLVAGPAGFGKTTLLAAW